MLLSGGDARFASLRLLFLAPFLLASACAIVPHGEGCDEPGAGFCGPVRAAPACTQDSDCVTHACADGFCAFLGCDEADPCPSDLECVQLDYVLEGAPSDAGGKPLPVCLGAAGAACEDLNGPGPARAINATARAASAARSRRSATSTTAAAPAPATTASAFDLHLPWSFS